MTDALRLYLRHDAALTARILTLSEQENKIRESSPHESLSLLAQILGMREAQRLLFNIVTERPEAANVGGKDGNTTEPSAEG